jgi:protein phosphatase
VTITIPELSLVVLVGASGSGKSTFARAHFKATEIVSSDACRAMVADDENDQSASPDTFELLHFIAAKRLAAGRLTVVDATNVQREARAPLVALARRYHCLPVAIVLDVRERVCADRNAARPARDLPPHALRRQVQQLRRSINSLRREGFRHIAVLREDEIDVTTVERQPLWCDRRSDTGPFDIIGDVHGCCDELEELLAMLGYDGVRHPDGRTVVFLGDLVDRGPRILDTLAIVRAMVEAGTALCVPGNHDMKLVRKLRGRDVQITHGLDRSLAEIDAHPSEAAGVAAFLDGLVSHYVLDGGSLVVAHAGMREEMQGRGSAKVRDFALYGETTGETDEFGLPVRYEWAKDYRGRAMVVYGHTPVPEPEWLNRTINIDTGCVFGGRLTALRYPELELGSIPARAVYTEPIKPLGGATATRTAQQELDDVLDLEDVTGRRVVTTRLMGTVTIREENAIAALEAMTRFAVDPRWLVYLPPTMSPSETSRLPDLLEHPAESFAYYRTSGVSAVVCEEKHMGSRAVVVACRDTDVARSRFGVEDGSAGIVYTRTGRRFTDDESVEAAIVSRVAAAFAGAWAELGTDWMVLDCEIMPWSAKAQELIRTQYAAVGAAARASLASAAAALDAASADVGPLRARVASRRELAERFVDAYGRYCWPVAGIDDLRVAPFHVLATENEVHASRGHDWHMQTIAAACEADRSLLTATPYRVVETTDPAQEADATAWWEALVASGGEGMVVKPVGFVVRGGRGMAQPALKCRGPEYLRIIYGPEYTEHLDRLRGRGLGHKRSLALREFALGVEALERFVRREPLRRVHECVFGVLAFESEPVDPRL